MLIHKPQPEKSQHAKYLPKIRETIRNANPKKIWADFKLCKDSTTLPNFDSVPMERKLVGKIDGHDITATKPKNESDRWLVELLAKTNGFEGGFGPAEKLIAKVLDETTPTFELKLRGVDAVFSNFEQVIPDSLQAVWSGIASKLEDALRQRGYRADDISTPFEHALKNDAASGYSLLFKDGKLDFSRQHTPLSVIRKRMGILETAVSRELEAVCGARPKHYGMEGTGSINISFEGLGQAGQTLWLPKAINMGDLGEALKMLPLGLAFVECRIAGAELNVEQVNEQVKAAFKQ